eukprot:IDg23324t1
MSRHMAKTRVNRALRHKIPSAADRSFTIGDKVLVWREKQVNHRIGEWLGPYEVDSFEPDKKLVFVRETQIGNARPFNITQVKLYHPPDELANTFLSDIHKGLQRFSSEDKDEELHPYITEVINNYDPRASCKEMSEAKRKEIRGLLERGTFKVILKEDVPADANVLPGRLILAIKSTEDGQIKFKARYVIGGHRDKMKNLMVHSAITLQPSSIRLILAIAAIHGFGI